MDESYSVVIVPNKLRYINFIQKYLHPKTLLIQYRYDSGFSGILDSISHSLGTRKVTNMAIILYSTPFGIYLCSNDGRVQRFCYDTIYNSVLHTDFFTKLNYFFDKENCRIDILSCNLSTEMEIKGIQALLMQAIGIPCFISKDLWGNDILLEETVNNKRMASDLYFSNTNLSSFIPQQTMENFEKIRLVGKGAFGTAVLYKKKDDNSLVILKEINMHDLSASERQMAMNEVKVLSLLDHPNIVAYYDSFEEDGILIIEMEYADNGTLCQFLSNHEKLLEEKLILELFQQMVAAIHYIHEHKILHRDLKTANIFLTKEEIIKIGDFGISKMLTTTKSGTNSVIGTPHYISPEMCQGKVYNEKSDVWSLGCILYEMTCLHKTFEGSNLPAIVNKIMKCQFEAVKGNYSDELKELISLMLQKNPEDRSSTDIILYHKLPLMLKKFETKVLEDSGLTRRNTRVVAEIYKRSVLYVMDIGTLSLTPVALPSQIRIKQVCSSKNHVIVLTTEAVVYTWGCNTYGQLGHGDLKYRVKPETVSCLCQKALIRISCGNNFSIFGSENGIIMTCGQGSNGCLGHGDFKDVVKPKLIESLLSVDIICISATFEHIVVVTSENAIYGWGNNKNDQLGLPSNTIYNSPQEINIYEPVTIKNAYTSEDATMLLTDSGALLACGSNYGNKLGLNARLGFLMTMKSISQQTCVSEVSVFTAVRSLSRHRIIQVSMGTFHTVVICQSGKIISFGINSEGQLGNGHSNNVPITSDVRGLRKSIVTKITSGLYYSVAYVNYDSLYFWGRRLQESSDLPLTTCTDNMDRLHSPKLKSAYSCPETSVIPGNAVSFDVEREEQSKIHNIPVLILQLKNFKVEDPLKELVCLTDCITFGECNLLVQIETTAPPPKRRKKRLNTVNSLKKKDLDTLRNYPDTLVKSRKENLDSDSIPTWIKDELRDAVEPDVTSVFKDSISSNSRKHISNKSAHKLNSLSNHSVRIFSSSESTDYRSHSTQLFSTFVDSCSLPNNKVVSLRRNKSEDNFKYSNTPSDDKRLEQQLNSLQMQLQTQKHVIAKSTDLINKLQNEIDRLHMEKKVENAGSVKHSSTICVLQ